MAKLLAVPIGVKGLAMSASAIAHVALAFVSFSGGHATSALAAASDPRSDEVEVELPIDPPEATPEPTPVVKPEPRDDHPHAKPHAARPHTHDYPVPPSHDARPHDPRAVHLPLAPDAHAQAHAHDHDHDDAPAAPAVVAQSTAPIRITITVGTGGSGTSPAGGGGSPAQSSGGSSSEIVAEASVSVPARAIVTARPVYPPAARAAEIEADVALEIVVDAGGGVVSARVARPAGYGLDDAAIQAIRRFRFSPAQRDGRAVGVRMRWVMQFRFQ